MNGFVLYVPGILGNCIAHPRSCIQPCINPVCASYVDCDSNVYRTISAYGCYGMQMYCHCRSDVCSFFMQVFNRLLYPLFSVWIYGPISSVFSLLSSFLLTIVSKTGSWILSVFSRCSSIMFTLLARIGGSIIGVLTRMVHVMGIFPLYARLQPVLNRLYSKLLSSTLEAVRQLLRPKEIASRLILLVVVLTDQVCRFMMNAERRVHRGVSTGLYCVTVV